MGISYNFADEWLTPEERFEVYKNARAYEIEMCNNFYEDQYPEFKISYDKVVFNCFWHEFSLQESLYKKFKAHKIQEVKFFKFNNYGPAVHESPSDTFGNFWIKQNKEILITPINIFKKEKFLQAFIEVAKNLSYFIESKLTLLRFYFKKSKNIILISCSFQEFYYYKENILEIKSNIDSHEVIVLINNINLRNALKLEKEYGIKFFSFIPYIFIGKFISHFQKKPISSFDGPYFALKSDKENFNYFEKIRWPALISHKKKLDKLIKKISPSVIVYTSLEDYFNQMIGHIAADNKIKSLSLSHGVLGATRRGVSFADKFAVANKLAAFCAEASGIMNDKICTLRDIDPIHEYPMNHELSTNSDKFNILVLMDPIKASSDTRIFSSPVVGYKDQVNALRDLLDLSLDDKINLIIKTHPGWPETEIIKLADERLISCICPSDTSLESLLDKVDLVIGLNYASAALIGAAKKELPVILHYVAPFHIFSQYENTYSRFLDLKLGWSTTNSVELQQACKSILEDQNLMSQLTEASSQFKKEFLKTEHLISLSEYLAQILNEDSA